jgi:LytS/YehU family sensor histidine kinase
VYLPWDKFPAVRAVVQFTILIIVNYLIFTSLLFVLDLYYENYEMDKLTVWQRVSISAATSIFISAVHTGYFLLKKWRSSMLETSNLQLQASELKQVLMRAELESLKMQLDPHFMFNNFSVLSELIVENKNKALLFLENISKVYRYMVSNIRKDVISLEQELNFLSSYVYLIKQRLGERFKLDICVDENELSMGVPPICLQLLVENAIKHNSATKQKPLVMTIRSEEGFIVVENNLQRINLDLPTSKIGLNNIIERYRILSDQPPVVMETEEKFVVKLSLIR